MPGVGQLQLPTLCASGVDEREITAATDLSRATVYRGRSPHKESSTTRPLLARDAVIVSIMSPPITWLPPACRG